MKRILLLTAVLLTGSLQAFANVPPERVLQVINEMKDDTALCEKLKTLPDTTKQSLADLYRSTVLHSSLTGVKKQLVDAIDKRENIKDCITQLADPQSTGW